MCGHVDPQLLHKANGRILWPQPYSGLRIGVDTMAAWPDVYRRLVERRYGSSDWQRLSDVRLYPPGFQGKATWCRHNAASVGSHTRGLTASHLSRSSCETATAEGRVRQVLL